MATHAQAKHMLTHGGEEYIPVDSASTPPANSDNASRSSKSTRSVASSKALSLYAAKKRAQALGAQRSLEFTIKHAETIRKMALLEEQEKLAVAQAARQKLELNADLAILEEHRKAAVAEAEAQALQEIELNDGNGPLEISLPKEDAQERTRHYVETHRAYNKNIPLEATPRPKFKYQLVEKEESA